MTVHFPSSLAFEGKTLVTAVFGETHQEMFGTFLEFFRTSSKIFERKQGMTQHLVTAFAFP